MPTETPTPPPAKERRPRTHLLTRVGSVVLGQRPEDRAAHLAAKRVTLLGIVGVVVYQLLGMVGGVLAEQRQALRDLPTAVAQAVRETAADTAGLVSEVRALRAETSQHQAADAIEFAQLRGVVAGRLRCPPCPACTPCAPPPSPPAPEPQSRWQRER